MLSTPINTDFVDAVKKSGLAHVTVAQALGISVHTVRSCMIGARRPPPGWPQSLAVALLNRASELRSQAADLARLEDQPAPRRGRPPGRREERIQ